MQRIEIAPTQERANHSLGIRNTGKRFSVVQPIEWLHDRGKLGNDPTEAKHRLEAGRYFVGLYIISEERPNKAAMLDWSKFLTGCGSSSTTPPDVAADYQNYILDKKREYISIKSTLVIRGTYGKKGVDVLMEICGSGITFKEIEKKHHLVRDQAGNMLRVVLDDLRKFAGLN